jgi:Chaperone of endosialidase
LAPLWFFASSGPAPPEKQLGGENERKNGMNPLIQFKTAILLFLSVFVLGSFAPSPKVQAQLPSPTPDGSYPGRNTAEGQDALSNLTTGVDNTAVGYQALFFITTGYENTAIGGAALNSNDMGFKNAAVGHGALTRNKIGYNNTAIGGYALQDNTTGGYNTATGYGALQNNQGDHNTAVGGAALQSNQGFDNTATGYAALSSNVTGWDNEASGVGALMLNKDGNCNTATGSFALLKTTSSGNIALGFLAGQNLTTGDNNIDIGNEGVSGEAKTIRIGTTGTHSNAYIAGIYKTTVAKGLAVVVDSTGHLGTKASSERFKADIKPMDKASEAILGLKPMTFRYKKEFDAEGIPQFGLVAEDVEKVNPDLVVRDGEGKVYTVRYDAVNAMLLNEFLKEHRKNEEQQATIARLIATDTHQQKQIEALTAGLQKVSAQLELSKAAPQTVAENY